jgi:hypothetical protein
MPSHRDVDPDRFGGVYGSDVLLRRLPVPVLFAALSERPAKGAFLFALVRGVPGGHAVNRSMRRRCALTGLCYYSDALRRCALVAALAALATALVTTAARAESRDDVVSLTWNAPRECPDAAFVRREIARELARARGPLQPVTAHASVERVSATQWRVTVETQLDLPHPYQFETGRRD